MDLLDLVTLPTRPLRALCRVPADLESVTRRGVEVPSQELGLPQAGVEEVWDRVRKLYRTGLYPGIQICVRREGRVVLHRAIGHARGNAPGQGAADSSTRLDVTTPFTLFSASKAITAMLIHKLDEQGVLRLDDRVCKYVPEFAAHGKAEITLRHILAHRAGIPHVPPEIMDLDLLADSEAVLAAVCETRPTSKAGRRLAYHAVSGGFVLRAVVERVTGLDLRVVLDQEIRKPLGMRWFSYGVGADDVSKVAENAFTGFPPVPPASMLLERALGMDLREAVALSNDPRFFGGAIPSANVVTTALELSRFYQCLLDGGRWEKERVFEGRTVQRAIAQQSFMELDFTLGLPIRYGLGFMLGAKNVSLYGSDTPEAFGHVGLTNILSWADPERRIAVALLTSGKPFISLDVLRVFQVATAIGRSFPKLAAA